MRRFNHRHRRVGHLRQGRYKAILVEDGKYLQECSRYIHLKPNRAKSTRPAERYRWSSYRNYVGGPTVAPWVETEVVLGGFGADPGRYRAYVEAGRGERQVSPFERAVAGLVLGGEELVTRARKRMLGRANTGHQPSLSALRREGRVAPAVIEEAVNRLFSDVGAARKRRLLLLAQRLHSQLRPSEIARRYHRTAGAVTRELQVLTAEAEKNPILADRHAVLATGIGKRAAGQAHGKDGA